MPRPMAELILSDDESQTLKTWASRPKSTQQLATRARIVLACADGLANKQVAAKLGVTVQTVGKWRKRFLERRLDGLADQERPGAPRKVSDEDVEAVITKTLETKPKAATHWSTRGMAEATGLSQSPLLLGSARESKNWFQACTGSVAHQMSFAFRPASGCNWSIG